MSKKNNTFADSITVVEKESVHCPLPIKNLFIFE